MARDEIDQILHESAAQFAIAVHHLTSQSKLSEVVAARKVAARRFAERGMKAARIARLLGTHHSTIAGYLGRRKVA